MYYIKTILTDIFTTVYRYLGFGIIFGIMFITILPLLQEKGWKIFVKEKLQQIRTDKYYRRQFIFAVYIFMTLARTLICRNLWLNVLANVIGEWGVFTAKGEINSDGFANIILFIPITFLGFASFPLKSQKFGHFLYYSCKYAFLFSVVIECLQLFLRLGAFQFSDIAQNTVGGIIGGIIYYLCCKIITLLRKRRLS